MKMLIALCFVALIELSVAGTTTYPRGCIYILGKCYRECEVGTHAFATACGYLTPEATCDNPNPVTDTGGKICDYSACYCDPPTVRNTVIKKCVPLEDCPKKEVEKKEVEKQEEGKKEIEKQEEGKKEVEKQEEGKKGIEKQEEGKNEVEKQEDGKKEVEKQKNGIKEVEKPEERKKEVEKKEEEKHN